MKTYLLIVGTKRSAYNDLPEKLIEKVQKHFQLSVLLFSDALVIRTDEIDYIHDALWKSYEDLKHEDHDHLLEFFDYMDFEIIITKISSNIYIQLDKEKEKCLKYIIEYERQVAL